MIYLKKMINLFRKYKRGISHASEDSGGGWAKYIYMLAFVCQLNRQINMWNRSLYGYFN